MQIGAELTRGLGSGSDAERGRAAAMEDVDRIKAVLKGADMVFITAGEGGGTGTGAAPVVARLARELGALTVGIVTKPFGFEGSRRAQAAEQGIEILSEEVDTLIVVPNNRLLSVLDRQTSMVDAFRVADDVLRQGVQGISDLITLPGLINLDFADVRTIMAEAGPALLGIGMGTGDKRATDAAAQAASSPLLETTLEGARGILLSITGGQRPVAVGGQRGRAGGGRGRAPGREHHLRRHGRRQAGGPGVGHRRGDGLRRAAGARRDGGRASLREPAGEPRVSRMGDRPAARGGSRRAWTSRSRSTSRDTEPAMSGVIAAGHPLTAEAGADVLRAGGNAVDAAIAAMLASFVAEPMLTGLGAGGYMLVVPPDEDPVLLDFFVETPGREADPAARAPLVPVDVSFGDVVQVFHIGAARRRAPTARRRGSAPRRSASARSRWPTSRRRPRRRRARASRSRPSRPT